MGTGPEKSLVSSAVPLSLAANLFLNDIMVHVRSYQCSLPHPWEIQTLESDLVLHFYFVIYQLGDFRGAA
jgi:hypothetical protein